MRATQLPFLILINLIIFSCNSKSNSESLNSTETNDAIKQYITVLGIAQDAGLPHVNCEMNVVVLTIWVMKLKSWCLA